MRGSFVWNNEHKKAGVAAISPHNARLFHWENNLNKIIREMFYLMFWQSKQGIYKDLKKKTVAVNHAGLFTSLSEKIIRGFSTRLIRLNQYRHCWQLRISQHTPINNSHLSV
jgi:hypothetical protein